MAITFSSPVNFKEGLWDLFEKIGANKVSEPLRVIQSNQFQILILSNRLQLPQENFSSPFKFFATLFRKKHQILTTGMVQKMTVVFNRQILEHQSCHTGRVCKMWETTFEEYKRAFLSSIQKKPSPGPFEEVFLDLLPENTSTKEGFLRLSYLFFLATGRKMSGKPSEWNREINWANQEMKKKLDRAIKELFNPVMGIHLSAEKIRAFIRDPINREAIENVSEIKIEKCAHPFLPPEFFLFPNIKKLRIDTAKLVYLSPKVRQWKKLKEVTLSNNPLLNYPRELFTNSRLTSLILNQNHLPFNTPSVFRREIPPEIGQLQQLTFFSASGNQLTSIPEEIGNCTALQTVYLHQNKIKKLPDSLKNLKCLETLLLGSNQLEEVPPSLGTLTDLKILALDGNLLKTLPEALDQLKALQRISVYENPFSCYPEVLNTLANRRVITMYNNLFHYTRF